MFTSPQSLICLLFCENKKPLHLNFLQLVSFLFYFKLCKNLFCLIAIRLPCLPFGCEKWLFSFFPLRPFPSPSALLLSPSPLPSAPSPPSPFRFPPALSFSSFILLTFMCRVPPLERHLPRQQKLDRRPSLMYKVLFIYLFYYFCLYCKF